MNLNKIKLPHGFFIEASKQHPSTLISINGNVCLLLSYMFSVETPIATWENNYHLRYSHESILAIQSQTDNLNLDSLTNGYIRLDTLLRLLDSRKCPYKIMFVIPKGTDGEYFDIYLTLKQDAVLSSEKYQIINNV